MGTGCMHREPVVAAGSYSRCDSMGTRQPILLECHSQVYCLALFSMGGYGFIENPAVRFSHIYFSLPLPPATLVPLVIACAISIVPNGKATPTFPVPPKAVGPSPDQIPDLDLSSDP